MAGYHFGDEDYVTLNGSIAVSYTHLDVYKRQIEISIMFFCGLLFITLPVFPFLSDGNKMCIRDRD